MHTFAQKTKATKKSNFVEFTLHAPGHSGQSPEVRSLPRLPLRMKNQDVERMSQANIVESKTELTESELPRLAQDFSRIPLRRPLTGAIQTKLAINKPGDRYEQEADSIAESVMRMAESPIQRKFSCT